MTAPTGKPRRPPVKDPATGRFMPRDPTKVRSAQRHVRVKGVIPTVERRVVKQLAEKGVRGGHKFAVGPRARKQVQAVFDAMVAELGDKATASACAMAERIALRIVELRHWDAVLAEMRSRGLLVDRKRRAFHTIQMQYASLQSELRQDIDVWTRAKQSVTVDQFWRELQELKQQTAARVVNKPSPTPEDY